MTYFLIRYRCYGRTGSVVIRAEDDEAARRIAQEHAASRLWRTERRELLSVERMP